MNRLGLLAPPELSSSQREAYDVMKDYTTSNYRDKFQYLDLESRLLGPFGIQLHHPEVANAFIQFANALRTIPDFPHEGRECAILGVGSRMQAAYESYAHESLSGFSKSEQDQLHSGTCPEHFSEAQKVAYKIALELGRPGPLTESSWIEVRDALGVNGATALVHYVGFYAYVATILNGFDGRIPI